MTEMTAAVRRDRAVLVIAIAVLTVLAWAYLLHLAGHMNAPDMMPASDAGAGERMSMPVGSGAMAGMDMGHDIAAAVEPGFRPWGFTGFALVFLMWAVMMVGMMMPSVAPMVLLYAAIGRRAGEGRRTLAATGWFVSGYLSIWVVFSLAATAGQWTLMRLALLTPMMASASGVFGGLLLIAAGLYQWSPLKRTCLRHCQTPLDFLMRCGGFRPSPLGAVRLGARHGAHCVGCCALLMTLLFVGGVMNLVWIAGLSILVLLEKVSTKALVTHAIGALLVAGGVFLLVHLVHPG
jgi:predicted metal-binding membrane protein